MEQENKIEELKETIGRIINDAMYHILDEYDSRYLAEELIDKGYRKSEEVALEVINASMSKVQIMISSIKAQEEKGIITEFNGGAKTSLELVLKDLDELKKKYTEGAPTK